MRMGVDAGTGILEFFPLEGCGGDLIGYQCLPYVTAGAQQFVDRWRDTATDAGKSWVQLSATICSCLQVVATVTEVVLA